MTSLQLKRVPRAPHSEPSASARKRVGIPRTVLADISHSRIQNMPLNRTMGWSAFYARFGEQFFLCLSADKWEYEARIAKRFGFEQKLEFPIPLPETKEAAH
jgi:hypothetical protein